MSLAWDQRQIDGGVAAAIAFLVTLAVVPLVIRFCFRARIFDLPGPLKLHSRPMPRLGGIALVLGIAGGGGFAARGIAQESLPFWSALVVICAVGIWDDVRKSGPWLRLVVQFAAAGLLWSAGWRLPFAGSGAVNLIATCVFVAAFVNAFNFLDGSDGLAAAVVGIIALNFAFLPAGFIGALGSALAWSSVGAAAAFLFFNYPPARIFMGDSGSTLLGFVIAFLAFDFYRTAGATNPAAVKNLLGAHLAIAAVLLFPVFVALLPLFDAALAIARRLHTRRSPFAGDRRHFYDLLLRSGWAQGRVVVVSSGVTAVFAIFARMALRMSSFDALLLFAASIGLLLIGALYLGSFHAEAPEDFKGRVECAGNGVNAAASPLRIAK